MEMNIFLGKFIETNKEETRKSLKEIDNRANKQLHEMEEKGNQKIKKQTNLLKYLKKHKIDTKQVKEDLETVQSMKPEIDTIKKTQNEVLLSLFILP